MGIMMAIRMVDKVEKCMMVVLVSSRSGGFVTNWGCRNKVCLQPLYVEEFEPEGTGIM